MLLWAVVRCSSMYKANCWLLHRKCMNNLALLRQKLRIKYQNQQNGKKFMEAISIGRVMAIGDQDIVEVYRVWTYQPTCL